MATRKKKDTTIAMPGTIGGATLVFQEPTVVKGSHLTVTTHPDGRTELVWDDEALLRDVRQAILKAESVLPVAETKSKKAKKNA